MFLGATARKHGAIHNPRAWGARATVAAGGVGTHAAMGVAAHASSGGIYVTAFGAFTAHRAYCARKASDLIDGATSLTISGDFCFGDGANLQATANHGTITAAEVLTVWNAIGANASTIYRPSVGLYVPPGEFFLMAIEDVDTTADLFVSGVEIDAL